MSDIETLRAMLTRAKVEFTEETIAEVVKSEREGDGYRYIVQIPQRMSIRVEEGYPGFYSLFTFNLDGSLLTLKAYE